MEKSAQSDSFNEIEKFGKFQFFQYILICLPLMMVSMIHVNYIFVAQDVNHRCLVPECEDSNPSVEIPEWWPNDVNAKCFRPVVDNTRYDGVSKMCSNNSFLEVLEECHEWVYEDYNSIVSTLNLGCQSWTATLVGSVHNAGMVVSMSLSGWIADNTYFFLLMVMTLKTIFGVGPLVNVVPFVLNWHRQYRQWDSTYFFVLMLMTVKAILESAILESVLIQNERMGRKPTIILCAIGGAVGVFKVIVTNYYVYLAVEFLESALASGLYTVAVVLLIEIGGESKRVMAGVIFAYAVYVGEVLFAFVVMWLKFWKTIVLVIYAPMILFLSYAFLLRESIRWQMIRGKIDEAKQSLKLIAKYNKLNVTHAEIEDVSSEDLRFKFNVVTQKEKEKIKDILNSKEMMIRLSVTSFSFFAASFMYYGLMIHSVLLPGNKYINFILAALASFPGDLLAYYCCNKYGRKISLQGGYIFSSVCLVAQSFSPESITWLKIALFLLGKLGTCLCFTAIYTYSLELFPTSVRGSMVGCGNTAARVGSMLAPLTPLLLLKFEALPSILFSVVAFFAAFLLTFTPETKTLPMFDTIAQVESNISKSMSHL